MSSNGKGGGKAPEARSGEAGLTAQPAGERAPTPLLSSESGNVVKNAAADVVNRIAAPFQTLGDPKVTAFEKAQRVVAAAASLPKAPVEFMNNAFARATDGIAKMLPSYPAALAMVSPVAGIPHVHTHPPAMPNPLPAIGQIITGCPSVLIHGMPAARSGDFGIAITCGSTTPIFEIATGSSKVFIGGARAARMGDFTRQCFPAPPAGNAAAAAMSSLAKAAKAASKGAELLGKLSTALGAVGAVKKVIETHAAAAAAQDAAVAAADSGAAASAEASAAAATAGAEAAAAGVAAAMVGADIAMEAMKSAMGKMVGKDPGAPMCVGAIVIGTPLVLIGGFPMPSWSDVAKGLKKLIEGLASAARGGATSGRDSCQNC